MVLNSWENLKEPLSSLILAIISQKSKLLMTILAMKDSTAFSKKEKFIQLENFIPDPVEFDRRLTDWLIKYNFRRPHQVLGYLPLINFHYKYKYHKVLPRYPFRTVY